MVNCWFRLRYFSQPGWWSASITATDIMDASSKSTEPDAFTVPEYCNSVNMSFNSIRGGVFANTSGGTTFIPGQISDYLNLSITGYVNRPINFKVHGSSINCTYGEVRTSAEITNIRYSKDLLSYSEMCPMFNDPESTCDPLKQNFNLANATDNGPNSKSVYFMLQIPTGIKGSCSATIYFTPVNR